MRIIFKKLMLITFIALLLPLGASTDEVEVKASLSWDDLYASRVEHSTAYKEAQLSLKSAQLNLDQFIKPYLPTISFSSGTGGILSYGNQGFGGGSLVSSIKFENILGGDLAFRTALSISPLGQLELGDPSLNYSRKLFTESDAQELDALASLLNAQASIQNAKINIRISLAKEILDARYSSALLKINQSNLEVLQRVQKATLDSTALRELERRILNARKSVLNANASLADISPEVLANSESLFKELLILKELWLEAAEKRDLKDSLSVQALECGLAAAQRRKEFAFLPLVPNPGLGASVVYDIDKKSLEWAISISLSYDVMNKGKSELEQARRNQNTSIYQIRLDEAKKSYDDGLRNIQESLQSMDLDKKIQKLDVEEAEEKYAKAEALFIGGFASEESLVMAQIDLSVELLAAQKIENDILAQSIALIRYYEGEL